MSLLSLKNLSISFNNRKNAKFQAVKEVNLKLEKGEVLGIVGESGSGKSVTALSILRLLPRKAEITHDAEIWFADRNLLALPEEELRQIRGNKIAFIFQEPMSSLNPLHKIGKQIAESIELHQHLPAAEVRVKTLELLRAVHIPEPEIKINAYPFELSGGQRQRVMIAMAIANNPQILIADEPTTALDVTIQEQIIDLLLELKQKMRMSIIFISHNLRLVHKIADNIAVMYHGEIVEYGTAEQIFNKPQHDYTKKLISSNLLLNSGNKNEDDIVLKADNIVVKFVQKKNFFGRIIQELTAVNQVSFNLRRGETLGVVGESGSGKTTLAMATINLIKHKGKIYLKNNDIFMENNTFNKDVQIVFQDPYNSLNPRMNVRQIVGEGLRVHCKNMDKNAQEQQIRQIIREVELSENDLDKYPHEFSGGQRQRIALARALILRPQIIILDEPTSALDVTVQAQIIALLKQLQHKYALSYIFISHDMSAVRAMSHRIMVMQNGRVMESGTTEQIFAAPQHPYTKQLIRASIL